MLARPIFLAWPLPAYIGTARISQYPNSAWSWYYLGLNDGYECPPMFGYLLNLDSLAYWRDTSIPEEQDMALADPHQFDMVACYSPHAGTDIKAPAGTLVYAAADGKVMEWSVPGLNSYIVLKHCLGGNWDAENQCVGGKQWYTTYMHMIPDQGVLQENSAIAQSTQLGTVYDQTINSHLHFAVGLGARSYETYVNPWGQDEVPWWECMWIDQSLCVNPALDYKRLAFTTSDERLFIHQGNLNPVEVLHVQKIQQIHFWRARIGVLDAENNLLLRDGKYDAQSTSDDLHNWQIVAEGVLDFQITAHRIG